MCVCVCVSHQRGALNFYGVLRKSKGTERTCLNYTRLDIYFFRETAGKENAKEIQYFERSEKKVREIKMSLEL